MCGHQWCRSGPSQVHRCHGGGYVHLEVQGVAINDVDGAFLGHRGQRPRTSHEASESIRHPGFFLVDGERAREGFGAATFAKVRDPGLKSFGFFVGPLATERQVGCNLRRGAPTPRPILNELEQVPFYRPLISHKVRS